MTSHMTSIELLSADGMNGKFVTSGGTLPGRRRTRPNMRWSHLNGSLVSSDPGTTVFIGKLSCWLKGKKTTAASAHETIEVLTHLKETTIYYNSHFCESLLLLLLSEQNQIFTPDFQNEKKNKLNYCFPRFLIKIMFINTILH